MALRQEHEDEGWRALTRELVSASRRRGATKEDAEDRAQDALVRLTAERQPLLRPPPRAHAHQALKLATIDETRRRARKLEVPLSKRVRLDDPDLAEGLTGLAGPADEVEIRLRLAETARAIEAEVGRDAVEFSMKMVAGWSEADFDAARHADQPSAGALRKRIQRAIPKLSERIARP